MTLMVDAINIFDPDSMEMENLCYVLLLLHRDSKD